MELKLKLEEKHSVSGGYYSGSFMKLASKEASKTLQLRPCRFPALSGWQREELSELRHSALTRCKSEKSTRVSTRARWESYGQCGGKAL